MVLDGRLPKSFGSYRTRLYDWVGHPAQSEIGFKVLQGAGHGNYTGHVSWNGATEVAK